MHDIFCLLSAENTTFCSFQFGFWTSWIRFNYNVYSSLQKVYSYTWTDTMKTLLVLWIFNIQNHNISSYLKYFVFFSCGPLLNFITMVMSAKHSTSAISAYHLLLQVILQATPWIAILQLQKTATEKQNILTQDYNPTILYWILDAIYSALVGLVQQDLPFNISFNCQVSPCWSSTLLASCCWGISCLGWKCSTTACNMAFPSQMCWSSGFCNPAH